MVRYETIIIDSNFKRFVIKYFVLVGSLFYHFFAGSSVTKNVFSMSYKKQRKPYKESVDTLPDAFVLVNTHNNSAFDGNSVFSSEAMAKEYMKEQLTANPHLNEQLQVIPEFETFSAS